MPCEPEKPGREAAPLPHGGGEAHRPDRPALHAPAVPGVPLAMMMMQGLVNSFGKVLVAGYTAATKIDSLAMLPNMNISNAMSSYHGPEHRCRQGRPGQGGPEGLSADGVRSSPCSSPSSSSSSAASCCPCSWTRGTPRAPMGYGLAYMHTVSLFYILMGLLFVPNGMLRGAGDMGSLHLQLHGQPALPGGHRLRTGVSHPAAGPTPSGGPSPPAG